MAQVPPRWQRSERRARKNETVPSASVWRARMPAAPNRPQRAVASATVMKPSPEIPAFTVERLGLVSSHHPHREELGATTVGMAQGSAGAVDLMGPRRPPHLHGRLGEPNHPR